MGVYDSFRGHAVTVIALTFCFRFRKESGGESGAIQNKSISLWRKDDFRNEELTRQTKGREASSVLQNGLFCFVMNGY